MNNTSDTSTIQIPERPKHGIPKNAIRTDEGKSSPDNHDLDTSQLSVMGNLEVQDVDASKDEHKTDPDSNTETKDSESDQRKLSSSGVKASEPDNTAIDIDIEVADEFEYDDLHLGHISEAHYVSLRHHDWEKKLYDGKIELFFTC